MDYIAAANPAAILTIIAAYREQAAELAELREKLRKLEEQEPIGKLQVVGRYQGRPYLGCLLDHGQGEVGQPVFALPKPATVSVPDENVCLAIERLIDLARRKGDGTCDLGAIVILEDFLASQSKENDGSCCCDGAAYGQQRYPFLVNAKCPIHGSSQPKEKTND